MYELTVKDKFAAAHRLSGDIHSGKCKRLHGHEWKVTVTVSSPRLDTYGMVVDMGLIKEAIRQFDHTCLNNDFPELFNLNPTAEIIARVIAEEVEKRTSVTVTMVEVEESEGNIARWIRDEEARSPERVG